VSIHPTAGTQYSRIPDVALGKVPKEQDWKGLETGATLGMPNGVGAGGQGNWNGCNAFVVVETLGGGTPVSVAMSAMVDDLEGVCAIVVVVPHEMSVAAVVSLLEGVSSVVV